MRIERTLIGLLVRVHRHPVGVLAAILVLLAVTLPGLPLLSFDMSFRPLFAGSSEDLQATADFEAEFGQASGAYLVAILETEDPGSPKFLARLAALAERVSGLEGVENVQSIANRKVPVWVGDAIELHPLPPAANTAAGALVSKDGRRTLLLARLDIPLSELGQRAALIEQFKRIVETDGPPGSNPRITGVSVVEEAYARLVLRNVIVGVGITMLMLTGILWLFIGRLSSVFVCLVGVSLATPATLGLMAVIGWPMTIINSMVPTMVMIIGVADAIHMHESFREHIADGLPAPQAVSTMLDRMTVPCLATTLTTVVGMLALTTADVAAIREFGVIAALGLVLVLVLNLLVVPQLLLRLPGVAGTERRLSKIVDRAILGVADRGVRHPGVVLAVAACVLAPLAWFVPRIDLDQRFNEELPFDHPVRGDQALLEQQFDGFLGPDVSIHRADGAALVDADISSIEAFATHIKQHEAVLSVRSAADFIPPVGERDGVATALVKLRNAPDTIAELRDVLSADGRGAALVVRTTDMGSGRSDAFSQWLLREAETTLGGAYEVQLVGQWWLAQRGMQQIVADMLRSFITALLVVLPLLGLLLQRWRMFFISLVPNLVPTVVALGFMALAGIRLRIGTAMILAIALGIAVDDTIHFLLRLRNESGRAPVDAVKNSLRHSGKAIVLTTVILVGGFLSMLSNDLIAIRDMGLVAAVTVAAALIADLILAPALYLLSAPKQR